MADLTDPFEQLRLAKQATLDSRETLQAATDGQIGTLATAVLLFNTQMTNNRLLNADPNTEVDVADDPGEDPLSPLSPAAGATP